MADSSHTYPIISASQSSKEVTANALHLAGSTSLLFGLDPRTNLALTFGYLGGKYRKADGTVLTIADGTLALTGSATNYILETDGVVSKVTSAPSGWPGPLAAGANALYAVVCGATAVTSYTDYRAAPNPQSTSPAETVTTIGALINGATSKTTPVDADMLGLMDSAASNVLKKLSWANVKATLKTYFDTLYATLSQPFDVTAFYPGVPTASAIVLRVPVARAVTFPDDFAGSYGKASVAATGITAFDVQKNGSSVGTISFAAAATTATFVTSGTTVVLAAGDVLSIHAPGTADATLANIGFALAGTR